MTGGPFHHYVNGLLNKQARIRRNPIEQALNEEGIRGSRKTLYVLKYILDGLNSNT